MSSRNFIYQPNSIFQRGPNQFLNACLGENGGPYGLDAYAFGYFQSSLHLAKSACEGATTLDIAVYPIMFNFRHAVELGIKFLVEELSKFDGSTDTPQLTHRLSDNWNIVKPLLLAEQAFDENKAIQPMDRLIADFIGLDADGQTFRYPTDRSGNRFHEGWDVINVGHLVTVIEEVSNVFSYWFTIVETMYDRREMLDESSLLLQNYPIDDQASPEFDSFDERDLDTLFDL